MTQPEWMLTDDEFEQAIDKKILYPDHMIDQRVILKAQARKIVGQIEKQMLHKPNDELFVSNGCYLISIGNWEQLQREVGNG